MTTVINNPTSGESTGAGMIVGVVLVIAVLLGLFYFYGLPMMTNKPSSPGVNVDVNLPATNNQ